MPPNPMTTPANLAGVTRSPVVKKWAMTTVANGITDIRIAARPLDIRCSPQPIRVNGRPLPITPSRKQNVQNRNPPAKRSPRRSVAP